MRGAGSGRWRSPSSSSPRGRRRRRWWEPLARLYLEGGWDSNPLLRRARGPDAPRLARRRAAAPQPAHRRRRSYGGDWVTYPQLQRDGTWNHRGLLRLESTPTRRLTLSGRLARRLRLRSRSASRWSACSVRPRAPRSSPARTSAPSTARPSGSTSRALSTSARCSSRMRPAARCTPGDRGALAQRRRLDFGAGYRFGIYQEFEPAGTTGRVLERRARAGALARDAADQLDASAGPPSGAVTDGKASCPRGPSQLLGSGRGWTCARALPRARPRGHRTPGLVDALEGGGRKMSGSTRAARRRRSLALGRAPRRGPVTGYAAEGEAAFLFREGCARAGRAHFNVWTTRRPRTPQTTVWPAARMEPAGSLKGDGDGADLHAAGPGGCAAPPTRARAPRRRRPCSRSASRPRSRCPPEYTAASVVQIEPRRISPDFFPAQNATPFEDRMRTIKHAVLARPVIERVIRETDFFPDLHDDMDEAITRFRRQVEVRLEGEVPGGAPALLFVVRCAGATRRRSRGAATLLPEVYGELTRDVLSRQARALRETLDAQAAEMSRPLRARGEAPRVQAEHAAELPELVDDNARAVGRSPVARRSCGRRRHRARRRRSELLASSPRGRARPAWRGGARRRGAPARGRRGGVRPGPPGREAGPAGVAEAGAA